MRLRAAKLPTPLAWASARVAPLEGPVDARRVQLYVQAWASWSSVLVLTAEPDHLQPALGTALRRASQRRLDVDGWLKVLAAAVASPLASEVLGVDADTTFEAGHPVREAILKAGGSGEGLLDFVRAVTEAGADAAAAIRDAVDVLVAEAPWIVGRQLIYVVEVGETVQIRRMMGTSYPEVEEIEVAPGLSLSPDSLHLWNRRDSAVRVPSWLARYDMDGLRLLTGRGVGGWAYSPPVLGPDEDDLIVADPPGMPAFLKGGQTPVAEAQSDETLTGLHIKDIQRLRLALKAVDAARSASAGKVVILRVIAGRELMRFVELRPGQEIVIGRSPKLAGLTLHHGRVSRRHSKVWTDDDGSVHVQDLGSTNGTAVNGDRLEAEEVGKLLPGDVLGVGAVPLRLERVDAQHLERLRLLNRTPEIPDRDPLTGLLPSSWLDEELPVLFRQLDTESLSGVLMRVVGLPAIRDRQGQETADVLFLNAAKAVSYELVDPRPVVRTDYGEMLVVCSHCDREDAYEIATNLCQAFTKHVWEADISAQLVGAVAEARRGEEVSTWIERLRGALPSLGGGGQVFRS